VHLDRHEWRFKKIPATTTLSGEAAASPDNWNRVKGGILRRACSSMIARMLHEIVLQLHRDALVKETALLIERGVLIHDDYLERGSNPVRKFTMASLSKGILSRFSMETINRVHSLFRVRVGTSKNLSFAGILLNAIVGGMQCCLLIQIP
jgi:hypothetical protein